jgi:hypothetical protein
LRKIIGPDLIFFEFSRRTTTLKQNIVPARLFEKIAGSVRSTKSAKSFKIKPGDNNEKRNGKPFKIIAGHKIFNLVGFV